MCGTVSLGAARSRLFAGHREQKPPQISSSLAWAASPKEAALGWRLPSLQLCGCGEKTELGWRKRSGCCALSLKQLRVTARSSPARLFSAISLAGK